MEPKYKKVILKLSGEAIADSSNSILNPKKLSDIVSLIETLFKCGVKVGALTFVAGSLHAFQWSLKNVKKF